MEIKRIIIKSLTGELSDAEKELLKAWLRTSASNRELYKEIKRGKELTWRYKLAEELCEEKAWRKVECSIRKRRSVWLRRWLPYAALIVIGISASVFLWKGTVEEAVVAGQEEILPGGQRARLVLAGGETFLLQDSSEFELQEGDVRLKVTGSSVKYDQESKSKYRELYNKLCVPQGGYYSLILSDGTRVWVNAETQMEYPVRFAENERRVKLTGEAYFEVSKDPHRPFIVETADYQVQVLGTAFNVCAYPTDKRVATTLCTGRVRIREIFGKPETVELSPCQQLVVDREQKILEVRTVDPEVYYGWIGNYFYFSDNTLEDIFIVLRRWYGVEIGFANDASRRLVFSGKFPRFKSMNTILELMSEAGIKYEQHGRQITIK